MNCDVLIVGGGLAGCLAAWRLATLHPHLDLCVLEGGRTLGGSHTWSFHDADIPAAAQRWLEPLIEARWPCHDVRFPGHRRMLRGGYASITSDRLRAVIAPALGNRVRFDTAVEHVDRHHARLRSGATVAARIVIDARGGSGVPVHCGWQTFLGQELVLDSDHGVRWPLLMDATVPQDGGFRFVYVLPWTPRRLLVEDTLYADAPAVDAGDRRQRIARYAEQRGWVVQQLVREEHGALPIPLSGDGSRFWRGDATRIGVRAGLFHPTTGYSLPDAVAAAELLAENASGSPEAVHRALKELALGRWSERAFFRMLNRWLFLAAEPAQRIQVLDQFYRRPEPLIARFYADRLSWWDRCRLLAGQPPVPVMKALAHVLAEPS